MRYKIKTKVYSDVDLLASDIDDDINELLDKNPDAHIMSIASVNGSIRVYFEYVNTWKD